MLHLKAQGWVRVKIEHVRKINYMDLHTVILLTLYSTHIC